MDQVTIRAIAETGRRGGRFVVELSEGDEVIVSLDAIGEQRLVVGRALAPAELERLRAEAAVLAAYDKGIELLVFRPRAAADLRRRLVQKGIGAPAAEVAVERLVARGIVDDRAFAVEMARSKALGAGASRRRIGQELARRGVARDVADAAVAEVWEREEVDQSETVERLARRRLASLRGLDAQTQRRRLYGFLARRGYDADDVRRALETVLAEHEPT